MSGVKRKGGRGRGAVMQKRRKKRNKTTHHLTKVISRDVNLRGGRKIKSKTIKAKKKRGGRKKPKGKKFKGGKALKGGKGKKFKGGKVLKGGKVRAHLNYLLRKQYITEFNHPIVYIMSFLDTTPTISFTQT